MASNSTSVKLTLKITSFVLRLLLNIFFYIVLIILIISASKMAFDFTYQLYGPVRMEAAPGTNVSFTIQKDEPTMDLAAKLEGGLLIENKYAFYLKTKLQKSVILPGTYKLNTSMTMDEILKKITDSSASTDQKDDSDTGNSSDTTSGINAQ